MIMKYIVTESQYKLMKEQLEREVVKLPRIKYWTWGQLQNYSNENGNQYHIVRENLHIHDVNIPSLGKLIGVTGNLRIKNSSITTLGNLEFIGGFLKVSNTNIRYLGNLESIGGLLYLRETFVRTLKNLNTPRLENSP